MMEFSKSSQSGVGTLEFGARGQTVIWESLFHELLNLNRWSW